MKANDSSFPLLADFLLLYISTENYYLRIEICRGKSYKKTLKSYAKQESDAAPIIETYPNTQKHTEKLFFKLLKPPGLPQKYIFIYYFTPFAELSQFQKRNSLALRAPKPTEPPHDRLANRHGLVSVSDSGRPGLFSVATNCSQRV